MIIIGDVMTPPLRGHFPFAESAKGRRAPRAEQVLAFCWYRTQVDRRPWCAGGKRGPYYGAQVLFSVVFLAAT